MVPPRVLWYPVHFSRRLPTSPRHGLPLIIEENVEMIGNSERQALILAQQQLLIEENATQKQKLALQEQRLDIALSAIVNLEKAIWGKSNLENFNRQPTYTGDTSEEALKEAADIAKHFHTATIKY